MLINFQVSAGLLSTCRVNFSIVLLYKSSSDADEDPWINKYLSGLLACKTDIGSYATKLLRSIVDLISIARNGEWTKDNDLSG